MHFKSTAKRKKLELFVSSVLPAMYSKLKLLLRYEEMAWLCPAVDY